MSLTTAAALALAVALANPATASYDPNEEFSGISAGMRAEFQISRQLTAWNRGDLEGALDTYCPTAEIVWANKDGVSKGYEAFARSMRRGFGSRSRMGTLDIKVLNEINLGENKSLVTVRWSIKRGGRQVMGGVSSQLWALCDHEMRVVFEHAS